MTPPGATGVGPVWVVEHGEVAWALASQLDWLRLVSWEVVVAGWPLPPGAVVDVGFPLRS